MGQGGVGAARPGRPLGDGSTARVGAPPLRTVLGSSLLQYHMRIHKEERKYLCPDCGYKCKWVNQLKYHMTKHTGESAWLGRAQWGTPPLPAHPISLSWQMSLLRFRVHIGGQRGG